MLGWNRSGQDLDEKVNNLQKYTNWSHLSVNTMLLTSNFKYLNFLKNFWNEKDWSSIHPTLRFKEIKRFIFYPFIPRAIYDSLDDWQCFSTLLPDQLTVFSAHVHGRVHLWDTWGDNRHHMFLIPIYEIYLRVNSKLFKSEFKISLFILLDGKMRYI